MNQKKWSLLLAFTLVVSLILPNFVSTATADATKTSMTVSQSLLSMTEARDVEVEVELGYKANLKHLTWTFGGKTFDEWKKWNSKAGDFTGDPYITFKEEPHYVKGTKKIKATVRFDLLFNTTDLSPRSIRTKYPQFLNNYELAVTDVKKQEKASASLKLNVYDSYRTYDEIKKEMDELVANPSKGRYIEYQSLGQSVQGRDMHFAILAKDKEAIERYQKDILPKALENPAQLQKDIKSGTLTDYQIPIWFNNIHPDEAPGVDAMMDILKQFATEDEITYKATNKEGKEEEVSINVEEALDQFIFIFNPGHNADGRVNNTRQNANGFDLNRDNGYQTQKESVIVTEEIAKWTPLSFVDLHGFVKDFLIEPCTPPHNPNFEYDLLMDGMIEHAHAMGNAGIANTTYDSYKIPLEDYENGWDDATTAYTAMYAMFHGAMGHTVEIPDLNEESNKALVYASLGAIKYSLDNKERLYTNQLEIFKRGIEGTESKEVDKWLVNQKGDVVGRDYSESGQFFPDYYALPIDQSLQKNKLEVYNMIDYLIRNGVKVEETTKPVKIDDVTYPKGTFIVPLHQAKRGLANAVLSDGENVSDWDAMYDSVITNFPDLRGFDRYAIYEKGAFASDVKDVNDVKQLVTNTKFQQADLIVPNTNNDVIRVVNQLLKDGKPVQVITESGDGYNKGDFILKRIYLSHYKKDFFVETKPKKGKVPTVALKKPIVSANGSAALKYALKDLGFELGEAKDSVVIVDDQGRVKPEKGKAYIYAGGSAAQFLTSQEVVPNLKAETTDYYHEGILKVNVKPHPLTNGYKSTEWLYTGSGTWFTSVPQNGEVLLQVSDDADFYKAGWWPGQEAVKGKDLAFTWSENDYRITAFANDLTFRAHSQQSYRLLANAIFEHSVK
ncbi:M14 family zinc carboxypeptidase [Bacillus sp. CGMCC 1.16541]|uniref:M14 family metallopeptidase n=1 Tax=Bacillus sp. CGMCC 1.16541 TaxID=2185143 RepID=UPI000D736983|nr:M14 family zinc carboxypeptidase [Bacillus sp. CGMCC 1.16541]